MIGNQNLSQWEKNLIIFLRLFQNRPLHLAKYFLDNDCFSEKFKKSVSESKKLTKLSEDYEFSELPAVYFLNFKEMMRFFDSVSNQYDLENIDEKNITELNTKLDELIKQERYEEAIKIRDFMVQNNIKRNI